MAGSTTDQLQETHVPAAWNDCKIWVLENGNRDITSLNSLTSLGRRQRSNWRLPSKQWGWGCGTDTIWHQGINGWHQERATPLTMDKCGRWSKTGCVQKVLFPDEECFLRKLKHSCYILANSTSVAIKSTHYTHYNRLDGTDWCARAFSKGWADVEPQKHGTLVKVKMFTVNVHTRTHAQTVCS